MCAYDSPTGSRGPAGLQPAARRARRSLLSPHGAGAVPEQAGAARRERGRRRDVTEDAGRRMRRQRRRRPTRGSGAGERASMTRGVRTGGSAGAGPFSSSGGCGRASPLEPSGTGHLLRIELVYQNSSTKPFPTTAEARDSLRPDARAEGRGGAPRAWSGKDVDERGTRTLRGADVIFRRVQGGRPVCCRLRGGPAGLRRSPNGPGCVVSATRLVVTRSGAGEQGSVMRATIYNSYMY